jgi:hypothetical protein
VLVVLPQPDRDIELSFRNLGNVKVTYAGSLSVYDVLFNATFVLGAGLAAALVPPSGLGTAVVVGMVAVYLAAGLVWTGRERRAAAEPEPEPTV